MAQSNYLTIAKRDLREAEIMFSHGAYNTVSRFCQQAVEKTMKYLLEQTGDTEVYAFLRVHNLSVLYRELVSRELLTFDKEVRGYLAILKDYYYDLNYPGENYRDIEEDEAKEALEFAQRFVENHAE